MGSGWHSEGKQRERIAAYLVAVPPLARQTAFQKKRTRAVLRRLWRVETEGVLRQAGRPRRLRQGDMLALVTVVLYSAVRLVGADTGLLSVIVPARPPAVHTALEPRVLQMGIVALLREALAAGHVTAVVEPQAGFLRLSLQSEAAMVYRSRALELAKETARLHGGSLAVYPHSAVLTLNTDRRASQPAVIPTADTLSRSLTAVPVVGLVPLIPHF